jgi:hypothetical protein
MGRDFRKLWAAGAVSNVGDGIALAAFPLLAAAFSRDPAAVATFPNTGPCEGTSPVGWHVVLEC